jgi:hypothetical protein
MPVPPTLVVGDAAFVGLGVLLPRDQVLVDESPSASLDRTVLGRERIRRHGAESRRGLTAAVDR